MLTLVFVFSLLLVCFNRRSTSLSLYVTRQQYRQVSYLSQWHMNDHHHKADSFVNSVMTNK